MRFNFFKILHEYYRMNVQTNIDNVTKRLKAMEGEMHHLAGMLEVLTTLQKMGVKVVEPEKLKETSENEVIDAELEVNAK